MADEQEPKRLSFTVHGKDYPVPDTFTLGEMIDAERYFAVEFGAENPGIRMAAAVLWIAIKRVDPSVTVDDIRELPPEVFAELTKAQEGVPPTTAAESEPSGNGSENAGDAHTALRAIGTPT